MKKYLCIVLIVLFCSNLSFGEDLNKIISAIRTVETHGNDHLIGDGGDAIGPLQIHRSYWLDSKVPGKYENCFDFEYSRLVFTAYMKRYCPKALQTGDAETLARVHNGGPKGAAKEATMAYWNKVKHELER